MKSFYKLFHELLKGRIERYKTMYFFGEDSIRYDFYHTARVFFELSPLDLILEQAIPSSQFIPRERNTSNSKQGRHIDKPEFDLRIDPNEKLENGLLVEFAYFRGTEISFNQSRTANHGKILKEIFRLALLKHFRNLENQSIYKDFSNYRCLLVCVTDAEMLDYGYNLKGPRSTPIQDDYVLTRDFLERFKDSALKIIDQMFFEKVNELRIVPTARTVFKKVEEPTTNTPRWATWIWEVDFREI